MNRRCSAHIAAQRFTHETGLRVLAAVCLTLGLGCAERTPAAPTWTLTETLRLGGDESGPSALDYVKGVDEGADGRVFVYVHSSQDIRVFAADGAFLRVIGRKGSGPGEFRNAEGIVVTADGKLWVRDAANARFAIFGPTGEFEKNWTAQFCSSQGMWEPSVDSAGRVLSEDCIVEGERAVRRAVLAYRTDLSGVDTVRTKPACESKALAEAGTWITRSERSTSYWSIPFRAIYLSAVDSRGDVWCAPNSARYELWRFALGSADSVVHGRALKPVPVSIAERDSVIADVEAKGPTGLDFSRIPAVKPAIERLTVDDRDRLWVRRTDESGAVALDVFDSQGVLLGSASLRGHRISRWRPFVVRGDNVYAVVLGQDDIEYVVRFRISGN